MESVLKTAKLKKAKIVEYVLASSSIYLCKRARGQLVQTAIRYVAQGRCVVFARLKPAKLKKAKIVECALASSPIDLFERAKGQLEEEVIRHVAPGGCVFHENQN